MRSVKSGKNQNSPKEDRKGQHGGNKPDTKGGRGHRLDDFYRRLRSQVGKSSSYGIFVVRGTNGTWWEVVSPEQARILVGLLFWNSVRQVEGGLDGLLIVGSGPQVLACIRSLCEELHEG
jgi:hypothetical protein